MAELKETTLRKLVDDVHKTSGETLTIVRNGLRHAFADGRIVRLRQAGSWPDDDIVMSGAHFKREATATPKTIAAASTINEREVHAGFAAHDSKRICKAVGAQARRLRSGEFSAMTLGEWVPIRWYSAELDEQGKLTIDRENWRRRHTPAEVVELRWIHGDAEDALVELRTEEAIRLGADRVTNDRP